MVSPVDLMRADRSAYASGSIPSRYDGETRVQADPLHLPVTQATNGPLCQMCHLNFRTPDIDIQIVLHLV